MADDRDDTLGRKHREGQDRLNGPERIDATEHGSIRIASLPTALQDAFERLHPLLGRPEPGSDGCMNPADWLKYSALHYHRATQHMRKRSLRMAWAGPSADDLADAPVLSRWMTVIEPQFMYPALMGHAPDHPNCVGELIVTSRLCGLCKDSTWARTVSRWYRLEEPATLEAFMERNAARVERRVVHPLRTRDALLMTTWEQVAEME